MVILIWLVLFFAIVSLLFLVLAFSRQAIYECYSGGRPVTCPKDQQGAVVSIDLHHAGATAVDGSPDLRLSACTCWPERANCNQECLAQALHAEPYKEVARKPGRKQIYHLPVLLAAFAAWYVGMLWHSHYLFRTQWIHALGLTPIQIKQIVWWLSPHLLTAAVALLFAYGVAWLLAVFHRKGVLQGVLMAVLLSGAVIATTWFSITRLPHELFVIEAGYAAVATLIVGIIVGGLYDKLVLRSQ
jgi:hypothetical protein